MVNNFCEITQNDGDVNSANAFTENIIDTLIIREGMLDTDENVTY